MSTQGFHRLLVLSSLGLVAGRSFWSSIPATSGPQDSDEYILKTAYPIGNGRLGVLPFGSPGSEKANLNLDSLWSGGPFEAANYTGGNPRTAKSSALPGIRANIFKNGTGDVDALLGSGDNYGSYQVLGNLTFTIDSISKYTDYKRSLDLETGVHTTTFKVGGSQLTSTTFCSYPDEVCVYAISADGQIPDITLGIENSLESQDLLKVTCGDSYVRLTGLTQAGPPEGMRYDAVARVTQEANAVTSCSDDDTLKISLGSHQRSVVIVIGAGTNFDQSKGNAENNFSFKGADPATYVDKVTMAASAQHLKSLLHRHIADYTSIKSKFSLDLPDPRGSATKETATVISEYAAAGPGDPFLEALLFDYSQHLLISSSRENSLPANLQGRWAESLQSAWSGDYHANINLQMNYWAADQTGLGQTQDALWEYMRLNWGPRGTETARLLYDAPGWVTHDEMNIFGHTAMKDSATWANYPAAPAWMMQHVWDYFDYTQDTAWLAEKGYPLIKGVSEFWLSQLQEDAFFNDGTLVVNPCNSPEHGPTTFGCAHYQQEIHQVLEATIKSAFIIGEKDQKFVRRVSSGLSKLDKGLHYTEWGGVKEWKLPDSYGYDVPNTHRHLSHLTGWYPGYSVSSFLGGYTNTTIQSAVQKTLISRGNGTGDDADSGWEKVWRSACWARLNNTEQAYFELRYAIDTNFANNGFSMYSGLNSPFQIDANFGLGGAILSMLVVDMPLAYGSKAATRTVVLGPAIPASWAGGRVKGLRIRGGGSVDFDWDARGLVTKANLTGSKTPVEIINKEGKLLAKGSGKKNEI